MQRLLLYTGNYGYGLTTDRFYPMAFMVFLALVFAWFSLTVLRGARQQFAWGTFWLALFVLGTLHILNPDDFIVRTNLRLMEQGREFDAHYNSRLSADAVPALLENLGKVSAEKQSTIVCGLQSIESRLQNGNDFRSWNYSRWSAQWKLYEQKPNGIVCGQRENDFYNDF